MMQLKAWELRDGDVLRIGTSGNYVRVADAVIAGGTVNVTIYDGPTPTTSPTLVYMADVEVYVSARGKAAV